MRFPFGATVTLLELRPDFPDLETIIDRLRAAYLTAFEDIAPLPPRHTAAHIAEVIGALHQAVSYHSIVFVIEPVACPDLAAGLSFF